MMPTAFGDWLALILSCIAVAGYVYSWFTSGEKVNAAAIKAAREEGESRHNALETRVRTNHDRLLAIENEMKHLPDRDQAHRLELAIEKMTGRLEAMEQKVTGRIDTLDERLKPVSATSARMQDYLIKMAIEE